MFQALRSSPVRHTLGRLAGALLLAAGLAATAACYDPYDAYCDIENVRVSGTPTQRRYAYDFRCVYARAETVTGTVTGSYDKASTVAQEKVTNADGTLTAEWRCPVDPWLEEAVRCTLVDRKANYKGKAQYPPDPPTNTYSSFKLGPISHTELRRGVDQLKAPVPTPPPPFAAAARPPAGINFDPARPELGGWDPACLCYRPPSAAKPYTPGAAAAVSGVRYIPPPTPGPVSVAGPYRPGVGTTRSQP
jgi:hypothetical protein